ncbi:probable NADH dehydrogenase [ubiquinone] 1 alpha subcomplex subunit 12 [Agrilus planipennis]|uniref:NADH dehydrogenase [ubiquinone] 1 alpha subcomplex subunit 12 n=1 Tax=Agrilus planipennis TaxID=224129 RepID=A0A1W4XQK1_AGRPL|nr:probable NADH dehydrogenase [ubiquinone] 1 alpha subcomplex subunit 12 [Agrilus planipennis]XP_025834818.1 probable NADH dehydrogenase [ubiquinone] 1 alpha subcomplex subunit 12 [Agrilus planipennis]
MAKFLGLDKLAKLVQIVKDNGGVKASLYKLYRFDDLRTGKLVGVDKYGNKYYENPTFFFGRSRWVEYADYYGMDYDGSQIPAEWFGWMHYKTDLPPMEDPSRPKYKWMLDHVENLSGTPEQYVPYSTTPSKIKAWVPPKRT